MPATIKVVGKERRCLSWKICLRKAVWCKYRQVFGERPVKSGRSSSSLPSSFTLTPSSLSRPESPYSPTRVVFRLIPDLPLWFMLTINLLQAEIFPVDSELAVNALFHFLQPNCCLINIRSKIIEVDIYRHSVFCFALSHFRLLMHCYILMVETL